MHQEPQKSHTVLIIVAVIGVIGTIIASIIGAVASINVEKLRQESALTQMALITIATQGGATQASMANTISSGMPVTNSSPPDVLAPTIEVIPTPFGVYNPTGIVQSDMPIYVDGFALSFREFSVYQNIITIVLNVKNIGSRSRVFRLLVASITFRDDSGNTYSPICNNELYDSKQINLDVGQSDETGRTLGIGGSPCYYPFPTFRGPMSPQAKSFFIGFKDFGPFTGFEIEVKP